MNRIPTRVATVASIFSSMLLAACGTSGSTSSSPSASASAYLATARQNVSQHVPIPTHILQTDKYTPTAGKLIFNVSCSLAIVGCAQISQNIGKAAVAAGEQFKACDAGTTPVQANGCFTNAVNAKADAIVVNAVGANQAGIGYQAAAAAGIPIFGVFTGNDPGAPGVKSEVAGTACQDEAALVADYVMVKKNGQAKTLMAGEQTLSCDTLRVSSFHAEISKCSSCTVADVTFDLSTMTSDLPRKVTAALTAHPDANYIVGVFDQVSKIAATAAQQAARQISVAGMDANPSNLQDIAGGGLQNVDITVGQGEVAWAGVDAAVRSISGKSVPAITPVNYWIIDTTNISQVPANGFLGPAGYEAQFKALWGK